VVCRFISLAVSVEVSLKVVKKEQHPLLHIPSNSRLSSPVSCIASTVSLQPIAEFKWKVCVTSL
jgi:hypothetical protein